MEIQSDIEAVKAFLKYLPRTMKLQSGPGDEETANRNAKKDENASMNELKEKLRNKIMDLKQKTKKKVKVDDAGNILNKRIRKQKPQKEKTDRQFKKGEAKPQKQKNKGQEHKKPNKKAVKADGGEE